MVDQDIQDQQYFVSQQHTDCITEPCNLISSANDDWLTVDITCLKETSLSQVDPGINITSKNLKVQDSIIGGIDSKADNQCCRIPSVGDLEYDVNNQFLFTFQDSSIMDGTSPGFYDSNDLQNDASVVNYPRNSPLLWNSFMDTYNFKMDDVFQVDKADLFHGPTLAELNANDESLFDSFDSFDSCLPSENITSSLQFQSLTPFGIAKESNDTTNIDRDFKVESKDSNKCSELIPVKDKELGVKHGSQVHSDLSIECSLTTSTASDLPLDIGKSINICSNVTTNIEDSGLQAVPSESGNLKSILLNFKISDNTTVKEPFLCNEKEPANSSWGINDSHAILSLSNDGEVDNKDNTDDEYEFSSDYDSDASEQMCHKRSGTGANRSSKKPRYFWQYNMQAKGPKGLKLETFDHSHVSDTNSVNSLLKFRRGDGNDLAPCPQKLYNIGMELKKLNSVINNLTPVNELPVNARLKSRKEKNKLASRACRLKKKAQHEANKLKLFGLQEEYDSLIDVLNKTKRVLMAKIQNPDSNILCEEEMLVLMAEGTKRVAGCTAEFVNDVLNSVEAGDSTGGLNNL